MIDKQHESLSIRNQCRLLSVNRSAFYRGAIGESEENLALMRWLDETYMAWPTLGAPKLARLATRALGKPVNIKRIRRLRRLMGQETLYPRKKLSIPAQQAKRFPYLLNRVEVKRPNQVWCADITYIPMHRGFMYLVAILDWYSRKVLSWRLSNTLDTKFCLDAFDEAVAATGCIPEIFNTDQGCQFTSAEWIDRMESLGIAISQDGRGRWLDNVRIERFWWSLKYEDVYLKSYENPVALEEGLRRYIAHYNGSRPHEALKMETPNEVYGIPERSHVA